MKREIVNKADFDNLVEKIEGCLTWYEKRNFDEKVYKLCLANGDNISIIFPKQTIAHLFGIKTEYLKSTNLFKTKSSYDMLKEICNDPYKVYKLVNSGYLTYSSFISPYADDKTENFIGNCGINDINSIEFICHYVKEYSFITGKQQLEGDYYICYRKPNGLLILGLKKEGKYYQPMTNRVIDFNDRDSKEFLSQLLTNQNITMISTIMLNNGYDDSKKIFYDYNEKIKKIKLLRSYAEDYDSTVEIDRDYLFVLEKYSKMFNLSKELDDVLSFISEAMQNKCPINLNKLKSTGVCLTESMINMINEYNKSLEKELTTLSTSTYVKKAKAERDKLREEFVELTNKFNELMSSNNELTQKIASLEDENTKLKEENQEHIAKESKIMKILSKK